MIEWLVIPLHEDAVADVVRRLQRAWRGSALVGSLDLSPKRGARPALVVAPDAVTPLRKPRWPDVLTDWVDIYEEPLFPSPQLPVAGEILSEAGAEALALFADLGDPQGARGGVAWFEKGGLVEIEQVGRASVAWKKGEALSRPKLSDAKATLASLGRRFADTERDAGLYERAEQGRAVTAEAVLTRALLRILGTEPPELNELFAQFERGPLRKLSL